MNWNEHDKNRNEMNLTLKWNEMKKWNEMRWDERKEKKWNEMRWDEMKWHEIEAKMKFNENGKERKWKWKSLKL